MGALCRRQGSSQNDTEVKDRRNVRKSGTVPREFRKEYDKAEEYYKRALEVAPDNGSALGNYGIFLQKIRKNYDRAEEYYKRALEADPDNANMLGNYAGFLLAQGGHEEGFTLLQEAMTIADDDTLLLECLFYQYAHAKDEELRDQSLAKIGELIGSGVRSLDWDLVDNVKRAVKDGHPHPDFLATLGKVISDKLDAKELDNFDAWRRK